MNELKTLKDLEESWESHETYNKIEDDVRSHVEITPELIFDDIKHAAIKWVNHYIKKGLETKDKAVKFTLLGASQSLIEFFNITEEDLK